MLLDGVNLTNAQRTTYAGARCDGLSGHTGPHTDSNYPGLSWESQKLFLVEGEK